MNRKLKFGIFLAISFLTIQMLATLHMAEHGFAEHKHNGHVCEIYLFCNHNNNASDIPTGILVPIFLAFVILAFEAFSSVPCQDRRHYLRQPRAPPAFSL